MNTFSYGGGGGKFSTREFSKKEFSMEGKFPWGKLIRGNYKLGEGPRIPKHFFFMSCFSVSILHVELLRAIARGKFSPVLNCLENISTGRGISLLRLGQISCHYLKTYRN